MNGDRVTLNPTRVKGHVMMQIMVMVVVVMVVMMVMLSCMLAHGLCMALQGIHLLMPHRLNLATFSCSSSISSKS